MAKTMGKYCKAYPITRLRAYSGWSENAANVRPEKKTTDGEEVEVERQLTADDHLYVQENHVVTDGIFKDENIIFDEVTPEWVEFCESELEFEIPEYANDPGPSAAAEAS